MNAVRLRCQYFPDHDAAGHKAPSKYLTPHHSRRFLRPRFPCRKKCRISRIPRASYRCHIKMQVKISLARTCIKCQFSFKCLSLSSQALKYLGFFHIAPNRGENDLYLAFRRLLYPKNGRYPVKSHHRAKFLLCAYRQILT